MPKIKRKKIDTTQPLYEQLAKLQAAVKEKNTPDMLVELPSGELGQVRKFHGQYAYHTLGESALNMLLTCWVEPWGSKNNRMQELAALPTQLVKAYIETRDWPGVPRVKTMAVAPVLRDDWSLVWNKGYDAATETWVTRSVQEPQTPVTAEELAVAKKGLWSLLEPFALDGVGPRADCIAAALTPFLMTALPYAKIPAIIYTATQEGSGKTTLAQLNGLLGTGVEVQARAMPAASKLTTDITTILNDGNKRVNLYDNIKTDLDDASIEALITSRHWSERAYHKQTSLDLENNTLWQFSMNNPTFSPDMARRSVVIKVDPQAVKAEWNPHIISNTVAQIDECRGFLVTLIRWWLQNGAPRGSVRMSNFEDWSETASGILETAGITGMLETKAEYFSERSVDREMIERIQRVMSDYDKWTVGDLYNIVSDPISTVLEADRRAIYKWIGDNPIVRGRAVGGLSGKVVADCEYQVKRANPNGTGTAYYRVVSQKVPSI